MSLIDTYELSNGVKIPVVGFGTWQASAGAVANFAIKAALASGYRHIDTAQMYGNEASIGEALKQSGISRQSIFITTKLNNDVHGYQAASEAIDRSLRDLQTDYLDLFLIHWPNPKPFRDENWQTTLQETWRALEDAYQAGKLKAIGVSNFKVKHFEILEQTQKIMPMVNQIRICPGDHDEEIISYCQAKNILLEAYTPLGRGVIFENETMQEIAKQTNHTIAQVCIRWSLQHGFLPLPKSVHEERIEENTRVFDFELTPQQMAKIDALDGIAGYAMNPDTADF